LAAPPLGHVFGDTRLRDLKPELEQLAVNAWRTPKRILHADLPYQHAQLCLNLRAALPASSISNANSDESRPCACRRVSGRMIVREPAGSMETSDTAG
jgi:hypothetical protein